MAARMSICKVLPALTAIFLILAAWPRSGVTSEPQSSSQAGGGRGSAAGAAGNTGSTANSTRPGSSYDPTTPTQNQNTEVLTRRMPVLFVSGSVVLEDGNPPPLGTVIERVCHGSAIREAFVDSDGSFSYQLGTSGNVIRSTSESGINTDWDTRRGPSGMSSVTRAAAASNFVGCEIRANLGGYRSSSVILTEPRSTGALELGTILLYPAEKIKGTLVSATSLMAPKGARKLLSKAQQDMKKKRLPDAEKHLLTALAADPQYAAAWYELGKTREAMNRLPEARSAFAQALAADEKYVCPYVELARLAAFEGNWQATSDLSEKVLTLDPLDFPEAYYLHALAAYNLEWFDAAERSARKAQRLDPYHRLTKTSLILAGVSVRKGDVSSAVEELRNYLKYAPHASDVEQVRTRLGELEKVQTAATRK